ncbi:MAG: hypothetical protein WKG07_20760 [Hymenobacter sp.]
MHDVTEQIERLAMMVLLLLFSGALVSGLLASVSLTDALIAVILLVIRPITGLIGLAGHRANRSTNPRLLRHPRRGSIYYLAYGLNHIHVDAAERLWGLLGLVVLFSIVLHGLTVTPIMRLLDQQHGRDPNRMRRPPWARQLCIEDHNKLACSVRTSIACRVQKTCKGRGMTRDGRTRGCEGARLAVAGNILQRLERHCSASMEGQAKITSAW